VFSVYCKATVFGARIKEIKCKCGLFINTHFFSRLHVSLVYVERSNSILLVKIIKWLVSENGFSFQ